uniref:Uncharacterized protein n=1 Tax=Kalanchoe fedtschenkoi TaxID=63787 RepID=A0A7N0V504_KALFE
MNAKARMMKRSVISDESCIWVALGGVLFCLSPPNIIFSIITVSSPLTMFFFIVNLTHKHKPPPDLMAYDLFSSPSLYQTANTKHHQIWWMTSLFLLPHQTEPQAPTKIRSGANDVTFASLPSVGSFFARRLKLGSVLEEIW